MTKPQGVTTTVVITTYNWPSALERCLIALTRQSDLNFDIVIADDGSRQETRRLIERIRSEVPFQIAHTWHEDLGFRRAQAINRAVRKTEAELLIFTDQDSLPDKRWVERHRHAFRPGRFVVGGYIRLTQEESRTLSVENVRQGLHERFLSPKHRFRLWRYHLSNLWSLTVRRMKRPRIMGLNFSVARDLFERVNGFDHDFEGWGKEDSDLRCRMRLAGGSARSHWHRSLVYHLWHKENPTKKGVAKNKARYIATKKELRPWRCARGLSDIDAEALQPNEEREPEETLSRNP